jgi:transcriptional regulator with XRE-family HTH domain
MSTKEKKSDAVKFLEKLAGGPLTIGGMISSIRLGEDKTLEVFAKKLKISRSHLCDIEKGRKGVSVERAAAFAKILGHSQAQFVRFALQDEIERAGLNFKLKVEVA